jgi:hypothetical protein
MEMHHEPRPQEIQDAKRMIIESAIQLIRIDPARAAFVIHHCFCVGFDMPSRRIVLRDMKPYADSLVEAIRWLREADQGAARLVAEDALSIAWKATTPKSAA